MTSNEGGWTCQECGAFTRVVYDPENCGDDTAALVYEAHVLPCKRFAGKATPPNGDPQGEKT